MGQKRPKIADVINGQPLNSNEYDVGTDKDIGLMARLLDDRRRDL